MKLNPAEAIIEGVLIDGHSNQLNSLTACGESDFGLRMDWANLIQAPLKLLDDSRREKLVFEARDQVK